MAEYYDFAVAQDELVRKHIKALGQTWNAREESQNKDMAANVMIMHALALAALMGWQP